MGQSQVPPWLGRGPSACSGRSRRTQKLRRTGNFGGMRTLQPSSPRMPRTVFSLNVIACFVDNTRMLKTKRDETRGKKLQSRCATASPSRRTSKAERHGSGHMELMPSLCLANQFPQLANRRAAPLVASDARLALHRTTCKRTCRITPLY